MKNNIATASLSHLRRTHAYWLYVGMLFTILLFAFMAGQAGGKFMRYMFLGL